MPRAKRRDTNHREAFTNRIRGGVNRTPIFRINVVQRLRAGKAPAGLPALVMVAPASEPVFTPLPADNRLLWTLPSGSKGIPERVIFLVGDRAALDRLSEIQHGAGLRIEHRPLWHPDAVRVAGGREIHPIAGHGAGEVAIFLGPRPFMRDEIAEHVGELGAMIGAQVLAEIFDIVLVKRHRRRVLEVIVEQLGLPGADQLAQSAVGESAGPLRDDDA
jgi:hypothetical protein